MDDIIDCKNRTGLYGGTFAPPHNGHIYAAAEFIEKMELDKLYIMPAFIPPHKTPDWNDDPALRFEMCRAAFSGLRNTEVSDLEIKKGGLSYTCDTLAELASPDTILFMQCGTDMFLTLDQWKDAKSIFELAHIVCIRRDETGDELIFLKKREFEIEFGADITVIDSCPWPASSSDIREMIRKGQSVEEFVPPSIVEIIRKNNLYAC